MSDERGPHTEVPAAGSSQATARGRRSFAGFYAPDQVGRIAADGSPLDLQLYDCAMASAWRDARCEALQCIRPEVARMVPPIWRDCAVHGPVHLPAADPFPFHSEEWRAAERDAWRDLGPRLGVPPRYAHVSLGGVQPSPAIEAMKVVLKDPHRQAVIFQGRPGCGKTTALVGALRWLAIRAWPRAIPAIAFYDFPGWSRKILDRNERDDAFEACLAADELLIDDLGSGHVKSGGFLVAMFEDVTIHREARGLPLLATTNLEAPHFRRVFGARIYDRIRGGWARWLSVDGPSLRGKPGEEPWP